MTRMTVLLVTCFILAVPAWAEADSFDPDKPFREALSHRLLESLFNQAMEAIEEHFELSGDLGSGKDQTDRRQSLRFKFYPEGKSKSDQHFTAEGWFGPSTDSRQQELHFRFAVPKSSADSSSQVLDNVL